MPRKPLLSVVMPAYNHRQYIGEAIASVLNQTYRDLELIVIDDGSTDGTAEEIAAFEDPRVRLERQSNRGSAWAINRGVGMARGELVAIVNSDDRWHPERCEILAEELAAHDLDFVVSDFRLIDGVGEVIDDPEHPWLSLVEPIRRRRREVGNLAGLLYGNFTISTTNFFFRQGLFQAIGPFRRYRYVQDWEYALRAALHAPERFGFVERPLFDYRLHGANTIASAGVRCSSEIVRMYARVLGGARPEWREPLARMRSFALDVRRTLGGQARVTGAALAHAEETIRALSAALDGCDQELKRHGVHILKQEHAFRDLSAALDRCDQELKRHGAHIRKQEQELGERASLIQARDRELGERASLIQARDRELAEVYGSRSWRLTRPLRSAVSGARVLRGQAVELLGGGWRRLPLSGATRFRLKNAAFSHAAPLFRGTPAYEAWLEKSRRIGQVPQPQAAAPTRPSAPVIENLRIPCGVAALPKVSVIVPVFNNLDFTLACLDAIARHPPAASLEVLIVDDGSSDATQSELGARDDIRYLRNAENLGFVGSSNRGAQEARGEFLFFLNNDTTVREGWLDSLVETYETVADVGLVGSKLIYPDGRLQEAGGIVWADGSGWNWGRLGDPGAPEYNFLRDADYCSGAALMIRRELFTEIGGFDTRYAPAYYEDTDLAFAVRARGLRVLYQPRSEVVHYEGVTSGTDLGSGVKAYQVRNRERFVEKWRDALTSHGDPDVRPPRLSADRRPRARLLLIDACTPTPDQDSGSVDMFNYLRVLVDLGYRVTFVPASNLLHYGRYTAACQAMGVECLYHPYAQSVDQILELRGPELDAVMLTRGPTAFPLVDRVRAQCPRAKLVFNTVDLHFLRERRRAELETGSPVSAAAEEMYRQESYVIQRADTTIVISSVEQELLAAEIPGARVRVIPLLREIPGCRGGFADREGILFVGGFRHPPNIDAMQWFCAQIWPLIHVRLPEVELSIVGSHMVPEVQALEGDGVRVLGFVEDIEPLFARTRLSVAPLRYGAGQKGKVVTSLGYGVPCVMTPVAAEGLGLGNEEGGLVAELPEDFASAVVRLYTDESLWERASVSGLARVESEFSVDANRVRIAGLFAELGLPA